MSQGPVAVELEVTPLTVSPGEPVSVRAAATNAGAEVIDAMLRVSTLYVDGEPSAIWKTAASNGLTDGRELELPPGERAELARVFDDGLLPGPGEHELVLEVLGVRSIPVRVTLA